MIISQDLKAQKLRWNALNIVPNVKYMKRCVQKVQNIDNNKNLIKWHTVTKSYNQAMFYIHCQHPLFLLMYALQLSEQVTESDNATEQERQLKKAKSILTTNLDMTAEF